MRRFRICLAQCTGLGTSSECIYPISYFPLVDTSEIKIVFILVDDMMGIVSISYACDIHIFPVSCQPYIPRTGKYFFLSGRQWLGRYRHGRTSEWQPYPGTISPPPLHIAGDSFKLRASIVLDKVKSCENMHSELSVVTKTWRDSVMRFSTFSSQHYALMNIPIRFVFVFAKSAHTHTVHFSLR